MSFSHDNILDPRTLADELRDLLAEQYDASEVLSEDARDDLTTNIAEYIKIAQELTNSTFPTPDAAADALADFDGPLILDGYMQEYAQEYAEDVIEGMRDARWPFNCIDWEQATREFTMDYSEVELAGRTYYYR